MRPMRAEGSLHLQRVLGAVRQLAAHARERARERFWPEIGRRACDEYGRACDTYMYLMDEDYLGVVAVHET
jgi:hypothetical protein